MVNNKGYNSAIGSHVRQYPRQRSKTLIDQMAGDRARLVRTQLNSERPLIVILGSGESQKSDAEIEQVIQVH